MDYPKPEETDFTGTLTRIIPSRFPPISVFEDVLDEAEFEIAYEIEAMTNDRVLDEIGDITRVPQKDRLFGPGSSPVMAAFTHIGVPSRFTDGHYGVYYAANCLDTAISETVFHRERFLAASNEPDMEITMRVYSNQATKPLLDIRPDCYTPLKDPDPASYPHPQAVAAYWRQQNHNGLLYQSVRHDNGLCVALFRPNAATPVTQGMHLRYVWSGKKQRITDVLEVRWPGNQPK